MTDLNTDILILSYNELDILEKIEMKISKEEFPETSRLAKIYQNKILNRLENYYEINKSPLLREEHLYKGLVIDIFASFEDIFTTLLTKQQKSILSSVGKKILEKKSENFLFKKTFNNYISINDSTKFLPWNIKKGKNKKQTRCRLKKSFDSFFKDNSLFYYSILFDEKKYENFKKFNPWNFINGMNIMKTDDLIYFFYHLRNEIAHSTSFLEVGEKPVLTNTESHNFFVLTFLFVTFLYSFEKKFNLFFKNFKNLNKNYLEKNKGENFEFFIINENLLSTLKIQKKIRKKTNIIGDLKDCVFNIKEI